MFKGNLELTICPPGKNFEGEKPAFIRSPPLLAACEFNFFSKRTRRGRRPRAEQSSVATCVAAGPSSRKRLGNLEGARLVGFAAV
jgi:hypothetical protein